MQDELYEDEYVMPKRKAAEEAEMDITPMIDITFLLLIFFLVASKMAAPGSVSLPPAATAWAWSNKNAVIITVTKGGADGAAMIYMGDGKDASKLVQGDPDQQDDMLAEYVAKEIIGKEYLLIKAEKDIKHRDVARVTKAVARVEELQQLFVAVLEVQ